MGQVRIIGGIYRRRIIRFKDDIAGLRPTPNRVKETVFNWLGQSLAGKTCLDLFAGSGAIGFEALSRGARSVVMVEKNRNIYQDLLNNSKLLKTENLIIKNDDALNYLSSSHSYFDIIFLDPPYGSSLLNDCLAYINRHKLVNQDSLIYIEYQSIPDLSDYIVVKQSKAATVHYALLKIRI